MNGGPYISEHGDVVSSALAVVESQHAEKDLYSNMRLEQGQIIEVYAIDSANNDPAGKKGYQTVYDVLISRPDGAQETIRRCRMLQPGFGGGLNNFFEVLPTDPGFSGEDPGVSSNLKRGSYVLVAFASGLKSSPVILGALPHVNPVAVARRPKKAKGVHAEGEFQGLNFMVTNDGELKFIFNGPRKDDGTPIDSSLGPTTLQIDKQGNVQIDTNQNQTVKIDRVGKKIHVTNGNTYLDMDQDADKIQVVAKTVEVGTGALQPQVVGDDWKKIMEDLIDAITQIIVPTGVGPSGTPVNAAQFNQIKSKLKEALSKNHKVEK